MNLLQFPFTPSEGHDALVRRSGACGLDLSRTIIREHLNELLCLLSRLKESVQSHHRSDQINRLKPPLAILLAHAIFNSPCGCTGPGV